MARTEDPFQRRRLLVGDESGGLQRGQGVERLAGLPSSRDPEREGGEEEEEEEEGEGWESGRRGEWEAV